MKKFKLLRRRAEEEKQLMLKKPDSNQEKKQTAKIISEDELNDLVLNSLSGKSSREEFI